VVAVAALALVAVVVIDLRRTVDAQAERARLLTVRDAERTARELRERLRDPQAIAGAVPDEARFFVEEGGVVTRPAVAAEPEPAFDPERELEVLAAERVARAARAGSAVAALDELEPLRADPALPRRARTWVSARMAWIAHRAGLIQRRDALLVERPGDPSLLLLAAATGALRGDALRTAFADLAGRIDPATARALCERLDGRIGADRDESGASTVGFLGLVAAIDRRRAVLREARTREAELLAARDPIVRALDGGVLLFWPSIAAGAVLDPDGALAVCLADLEPRPALVRAPFPPGAIPIVDGALAVRPAEVAPPGLLAGSTGTALLVAALALVCGGGSFLAVRALRREADALRLRTEFLTTVTHELKTPLAGVRLVAELLADDHVRDEAERRDWLRRLNAEAVRLGVLIENVLDLGRLDRGERGHTPERHDLAELVADTVALFAPLAERDGFAVRITVPRTPTLADVDRDALRQALVNVLDNARKYGRSPLEIAVHAEAGTVRITIRDHGDGVPPAERATIFDRFRRGAAHRHGSTPGVGIGLHLARAIAVRHGGTLACIDPPDGPGAQFEFRLPAAEAP
jgi:signal transduction histidine kinase